MEMASLVMKQAMPGPVDPQETKLVKTWIGLAFPGSMDQAERFYQVATIQSSDSSNKRRNNNLGIIS